MSEKEKKQAKKDQAIFGGLDTILTPTVLSALIVVLLKYHDRIDPSAELEVVLRQLAVYIVAVPSLASTFLYWWDRESREEKAALALSRLIPAAVLGFACYANAENAFLVGPLNEFLGTDYFEGKEALVSAILALLSPAIYAVVHREGPLTRIASFFLGRSKK